MTYEEIMSITPGSIVPGGCSVNPNATYMGEGEPILNADGSIAAGSHSVSRNDNIVVLDIGYSRQLALIQYPVGNGNYRQGYIINNSNNIQYYNIGTNVWTNGSTSETVYLSYTGNSTLGSLDPYEKAIFLYKVENRYNVVYSTSKGLYTKSGFVDYSGGITAEALEGQVISGGGSSSTNIAPGGIVPGGRTYPANAVIKFDSLYIRDENGNLISGRETSVGDEITVLDISYSKQLALIQYPSGNEIRQGYVTNNTKIINYINPYQWVNGSSTETVYLDSECTKKFGTISAYESATLLYEKGGVYCVAYDSPGNNGGVDMLNKCGFVRFAGNKPQATPSAGELLYQGFPSNVEKISYGTSPAGYPLNIYKIGNGSNVLFANFAIHGFEDDWNHDGTALVYIANKLIRKISATNDLHGWTVYINNCANPDGTFNGISMDGPGRCTVSTRIDMNRCFPYNFTPMSSTRNYTGGTALGAPEAQALHDIVSKINREKINGSNQMVVIDFHGWMGMTQGNPTVGQYFNDKFGYGSTINQYSAGFFSAWAQASLKNTRGLLVEYPKNTRSISQCDNDDYVGKSYRGIMQLLASNSGNSSGDGNSSGGNGMPEQVYEAIGIVKNASSGLNIREQPNTQSSILGKIKNNTKVDIFARVKPKNQEYIWYKIRYNNIVGYVREDYIDIEKHLGTETAFYKKGIIVNLKNGATLNVRELPYTTATVIGTLKLGTEVEIVAQVNLSNDKYPWYKIIFKSKEGYIRSDYVELVLSSTEKNENGVKEKAKKVRELFGMTYVEELPNYCKVTIPSILPPGLVTIESNFSLYTNLTDRDPGFVQVYNNFDFVLAPDIAADFAPEIYVSLKDGVFGQAIRMFGGRGYVKAQSDLSVKLELYNDWFENEELGIKATASLSFTFRFQSTPPENPNDSDWRNFSNDSISSIQTITTDATVLLELGITAGFIVVCGLIAVSIPGSVVFSGPAIIKAIIEELPAFSKLAETLKYKFSPVIN